jgi:hypothetical protein
MRFKSNNKIKRSINLQSESIDVSEAFKKSKQPLFNIYLGSLKVMISQSMLKESKQNLLGILVLPN